MRLRLWRDARSRFALIAMFVLTAWAVLTPWLRPFSAEFTDWDHVSAAPGWAHGHWLGTDAIGRDVLVRAANATRLSLLIGVIAAWCGLCIGLGYGALAGFWGGWRERVMMRLLDVVSALPFLLIVIVMLTVFGQSLWLLLLAIGGFVWFDLARVARAESARLKHLPYIDAARLMGASDAWLLLRHIIPNLASIAVVYAAVLVPQAILVESFLSFLGLSVEQPATSLGAMLFDGLQEMLDSPWSLWVPAGIFVCLLLALNFLSDALRDALDPRHAHAIKSDA